MIYAILILLVIIGILCYKLSIKQKIDKSELNKYNSDLERAKIAKIEQQKINNQLVIETKRLNDKLEDARWQLEKCKQDTHDILNTYHDVAENKLKEIDAAMEEQRQKRQEELDTVFNERKAHYDTLLENAMKEYEEQQQMIQTSISEAYKESALEIYGYRTNAQAEKEKFEGIERVLRTYDAEEQEKLFYTIQLPAEYQDDIDFLLTTVAAKVQHPDIISKLVWTEYVKPNIEDTFKRIEIKPEPGIYKLTSLKNGKCYIGKSTNVKNRIADHFKSVVGIKSIADQAVHHAILKEGFWNWQIEIITYCDKDNLNELEKYYIEFFKAQEFGYNKTSGG